MTDQKIPTETNNDNSSEVSEKKSDQEITSELNRLRQKMCTPTILKPVSSSSITKENLVSFEKYGDGKYEVSSLCMLTSPCKHYVRNTYTDKIYLMNGIDIYDMLHTEGIHDSHFDQYAEVSLQRKHPSQEDERMLKEYEKLEREMLRKREEEKIEIERQKNLGDKYKASSRLERLKAQNNISK